MFEVERKAFLDWPREVSIETYALCNARCTFCPYETMERKGQKMSDELLTRLADEMISIRRRMYFSPFKVNEPLLDDRVLPLCERINAEGPHIRLRIFTNGSPLTASKVEQIAKLKNVEHLWISLNSHIPEEYERLMGLKFEQTAKKLDHLHSREFPHQVVLSTVGFPNEDFRRYCFDRWPKFESLAIKRDSWLGYTNPQWDKVPDTPCTRWFELSVKADGKVSMCCMAGNNPEFDIGDVNEQTLSDVYNTPHWRVRRESLVSRSQFAGCNTCTY